MKFDPYNLFPLVVTPDGIQTSSPKITPFSKIPASRRHMVLSGMVYDKVQNENLHSCYYDQSVEHDCAVVGVDNSDYVIYEYDPDNDISRAAEILLREPNG